MDNGLATPKLFTAYKAHIKFLKRDRLERLTKNSLYLKHPRLYVTFYRSTRVFRAVEQSKAYKRGWRENYKLNGWKIDDIS